MFAVVQMADIAKYDTSTLINDALREGFALLQQYDKGSATVSAQHKAVLAGVYRHFSEYASFAQKPALFDASQQALYKEIHDDKHGFSLKEKLFFEFMLGLCRFHFCMHLVVEFAKFAGKGSYQAKAFKTTADSHAFWAPLHHMSATAMDAMVYLNGSTQALNVDKYWDAASAFFKANPSFEQFAKLLVSMQYVPADREILGLAQTLHWGGFGGDAHFIEPFELLKPLLVHRIGYHAKEAGGFNARMAIILDQQTKMKSTLVELLSQILKQLQSTADTDVVSVLDVGSGPSFLGARPVLDALSKRGYKPSLTASDVDPNSLSALLKLKGRELAEVRHLDLNTADDQTVMAQDRERFNVITAGLVLHQLAEEQYYDSMRFFAAVLKTGGLLINTDVGNEAHYQCLLVPANEVDREGHVPSLSEYDVKQAAIPSRTANKSKVLYPLSQYQRSFPSEQLCLYTIMIFQVCEVSNVVLDHVSELWNAGKYQDADKLMLAGQLTAKL